MRNLWVQAKSTLLGKICIFMSTAWVCAPILISFKWKLPEVFLHRFRAKNHMISRLLFEKKGLKVSYFRKMSIFLLKIHSLLAFKITEMAITSLSSWYFVITYGNTFKNIKIGLRGYPFVDIISIFYRNYVYFRAFWGINSHLNCRISK